MPDKFTNLKRALVEISERVGAPVPSQTAIDEAMTIEQLIRELKNWSNQFPSDKRWVLRDGVASFNVDVSKLIIMVRPEGEIVLNVGGFSACWEITYNGEGLVHKYYDRYRLIDNPGLMTMALQLLRRVELFMEAWAVTERNMSTSMLIEVYEAQVDLNEAQSAFDRAKDQAMRFYFPERYGGV